MRHWMSLPQHCLITPNNSGEAIHASLISCSSFFNSFSQGLLLAVYIPLQDFTGRSVPVLTLHIHVSPLLLLRSPLSPILHQDQPTPVSLNTSQHGRRSSRRSVLPSLLISLPRSPFHPFRFSDVSPISSTALDALMPVRVSGCSFPRLSSLPSSACPCNCFAFSGVSYIETLLLDYGQRIPLYGCFGRWNIGMHICAGEALR